MPTRKKVRYYSTVVLAYNTASQAQRYTRIHRGSTTCTYVCKCTLYSSIYYDVSSVWCWSVIVVVVVHTILLRIYIQSVKKKSVGAKDVTLWKPHRRKVFLVLQQTDPMKYFKHSLPTLDRGITSSSVVRVGEQKILLFFFPFKFQTVFFVPGGVCVCVCFVLFRIVL